MILLHFTFQRFGKIPGNISGLKKSLNRFAGGGSGGEDDAERSRPNGAGNA